MVDLEVIGGGAARYDALEVAFHQRGAQMRVGRVGALMLATTLQSSRGEDAFLVRFDCRE